MKNFFRTSSFAIRIALIAGSAVLCTRLSAQDLSVGLVSYWPMDQVVGGKTPDLVNGYDLSPYIGPGHTLGSATNITLVSGYKSNAVSFTAANQVLLGYAAGPSDQLPINKYAALTVSFWVKAAPNQGDLRMFSEGNVSNNNPLFNIGTSSGSGGVDLFFRQQPTADEITAGFGNFGGGAHIVNVDDNTKPYDNTWHQVVLTQQEDGMRTLYIDGVADSLAIPAKPAGNWNVNATSVGGILRSTAAAWSTSVIDEVALWKRALTQAEINELKANGLKSVFSPLADGLAAHWPMDEVVGGKTPDLVSGYDLSPYIGPSHTLGSATNITLVSGFKSNAVSFTAANQVLLGYVAGPSDQLPINKHAVLTVSFWVKAAPNQGDLRMFSEGNLGNNNPLFNIGTSSGSGGVDLFFRQQPTADEITAGFGNFGGGAHIVNVDDNTKPYDNTWHQVVFTQQEDGMRTLYIDGVADSLAIPAKPAGNWNVNATSVGGILRSTAAAWSTSVIDEVALWKRALTQAEINEVKTNGVPKTFTRTLPLQIKNFLADRVTVGQGETVVLKWEASADATLSISPGIGSVMGVTQFGVGSTSIVVNATATFTLTASRGSESTNSQATVNAVAGVAAGWRLIEKFDLLRTGHIGGQANWQNALSSVSGPQNPAKVVEAGTNKVLGFDGSRVLAATALNTLSVAEGQSNTLFFRFYISPNAETPSPADGLIPDIDINFGLTEKGLRDADDFRGGNNGPSIRIIRNTAGAGGPIDVTAPNGVNNVLGAYSYLADATHNPTGAGLQTGKVYNAWIDIQNRPFDVDVANQVQNGGDLFSLYIQKEGDATRTQLFQGNLSDRNALNTDPVLGAPTPNLTHFYFCVNNLVSPQGTNTVLFDDFFLSTSGFNSTTPVPASSFVPGTGPTQIKLTGFAYNGTNNTFTVTWESLQGISYTVQRKVNLTDASWTNVATGYPTGGATGPSTSYSDNVSGRSSGYYRVVSP